jgi:transposase
MNSETLHARIEALYERPTQKSTTKHKFSAEAKAALLQALQEHSWTTAREAYGWAWNELGLRVSYLTVWRFLNAQGFFIGDTLRSRKLKGMGR